MTYWEIFCAIYGRDSFGLAVSDNDLKRAKTTVARMSDTDWHEWICFRDVIFDSIRPCHQDKDAMRSILADHFGLDLPEK